MRSSISISSTTPRPRRRASTSPAPSTASPRSSSPRSPSLYDLRGKRTLEIGCGKGDFLQELARQTGTIGLGVDPGFIPERLPGADGHEIVFQREYFDPARIEAPPDFVVCRHTLEHVPEVGRFMRDIAEVIDGRSRRRHLLRDAGRAPRACRRRLLGHLFRALLLFHARLACAALPPRRARRDAALSRLRRPVHHPVCRARPRRRRRFRRRTTSTPCGSWPRRSQPRWPRCALAGPISCAAATPPASAWRSGAAARRACRS